jgi:hypothetical protein
MPPSLEVESKAKVSLPKKSPIDLAHREAKRMLPSLEVERKAKAHHPRKSPVDTYI